MKLEDFHKLFKSMPSKYPENLETKYPRIFEKILMNWESPFEQEKYFKDLIVDFRGNRQGFPKEVMAELLVVSEVYQLWRKNRKRKADDGKLKFISNELVLEINTKQQKQLTFDVVDVLTKTEVLIAKDNIECLTLLSESGISANQRDRSGKTPLMHAAVAGAENVLLGLIQAHGNPHVQDNSGNTALHWAVVKGRLRMVEILLYFGANPNVKNKVGATALSLSAIRSDATITLRLLDYGADILTMDNDGNTPLHKALLSPQGQDSAWALLLAGSQKDIRNKAGQTPQSIADSNPAMKEIMEKFKGEFLYQNINDK